MKKFAFTLAEILITIGIIGIVAEMTVPALKQEIDKKSYTVGLKKAYSTFNQALIQMANDYGCTGDLKCTGLFVNDDANFTKLGDALVKYFKVIENCGNPHLPGCFPDTLRMYYDGSGFDFSYGTDNAYRFTVADGTAFYVASRNDNCAGNRSTNVTGNMKQECAYIFVDVNGLKKPNVAGRDIFGFAISNGKGPLLYPYGGVDYNFYEWWKTPGTGVIRHCYSGDKDGFFCAGRIMEENWEMNY